MPYVDDADEAFFFFYAQMKKSDLFMGFFKGKTACHPKNWVLMVQLSASCYVVYSEWRLFWNDDKRTLLFLHLAGFCWYWVCPPGTALEAGFYSGYCIQMKYY